MVLKNKVSYYFWDLLGAIGFGVFLYMIFTKPQILEDTIGIIATIVFSICFLLCAVSFAINSFTRKKLIEATETHIIVYHCFGKEKVALKDVAGVHCFSYDGHKISRYDISIIFRNATHYFNKGDIKAISLKLGKDPFYYNAYNAGNDCGVIQLWPKGRRDYSDFQKFAIKLEKYIEEKMDNDVYCIRNDY